MMIWLAKAWTWVKAHWRWILFPVGILLLVLGWTRKTNVTVLDTPLVDADKKKAELDQAAKDAEDKARKERDAAVQKADQQADSNMAVVVDTQKKQAPSLEADEEALNKELLEIGKQQRS